MTLSSPAPTVLAIDPTSGGFASACLTRDGQLVGIPRHYARRPVTNADLLRRATFLLRQERPAVLVLEDCAAPGCRRQERCRALISSIISLAKGLGIRTLLLPAIMVRKTLAGSARASKLEIAELIASLFPEIAHLLPTVTDLRFGGESVATGILDAVAFALVAVQKLHAGEVA